MILVNNSDHDMTRQLFVWDLGTSKHGFMRAVLWTDENGVSSGQEFVVTGGHITITLPKTCAVILKYFEH